MSYSVVRYDRTNRRQASQSGQSGGWAEPQGSAGNRSDRTAGARRAGAAQDRGDQMGGDRKCSGGRVKKPSLLLHIQGNWGYSSGTQSVHDGCLRCVTKRKPDCSPGSRYKGASRETSALFRSQSIPYSRYFSENKYLSTELLMALILFFCRMIAESIKKPGFIGFSIHSSDF